MRNRRSTFGRPRSEETKKKISLTLLGHGVSEETRKKLSKAMVGRVHSKEVREKISKAGMGRYHSWEARRRMSRAATGRISGPQSEEHRRRNSEANLGRVHSEETKRKISASLKAHWGNMSDEERGKRIEAILKASRIRPTMPEILVGKYLRENFPGKFGYNGDYSLGISVGGRIPDFPNIVGEKEVISVMGSLGFGHFFEDEDKEIAHYAKYGYKCTVVWEWDCFLPVELDNIFGVSNVK